MNLKNLYEYAYWGVIEHIKLLTKLHKMCIEVADQDAANEYEIAIKKSMSDFDFIILALGSNKEECYEILNYQIEKGC